MVGGVGEASVRRARQRGLEPPAPPTSIWSQGSDGAGMGERVRGGSFPARSAEADAGTLLPSSIFALVDSAIAGAEGRGWAEHRRHLAELMVPFTEAAAARPDVAWFPVARTAEEIATPGPSNRFVAEPYTKLMCSFPTVDLAAAVVVCSARPRRPPRRRRANVGCTRGRSPRRRSPGLRRTGRRSGARSPCAAAVARALADASVDADAVGVLDLYSCFPAAVELAVDAFGLPADDRRPLTVTGGLPYFGGPGRLLLVALAGVRGRGMPAAAGPARRGRRRRRHGERLLGRALLHRASRTSGPPRRPGCGRASRRGPRSRSRRRVGAPPSSRR